MLRAFLACFMAFLLPLTAAPETPQAIATEIIGPLIDPVKVATLKGDRPANARLYKVLHWLEVARRAGGEVSGIIGPGADGGGTGCCPSQGLRQWRRQRSEARRLRSCWQSG